MGILAAWYEEVVCEYTYSIKAAQQGVRSYLAAIRTHGQHLEINSSKC